MYYKDAKSIFKEFKETIEEIFESDYYYDDDSSETYLENIYRYLYDNDIDYEYLEEIYDNDSYGVVTIEGKEYEFEYKYSYVDFREKASIFTEKSFYVGDDDYSILEMNNGIIFVHYDAEDSRNKYHFLDSSLVEKLVYTEPVLGEDGYIYFSGANKNNDAVLYRYDTVSHTYEAVE